MGLQGNCSCECLYGYSGVNCEIQQKCQMGDYGNACLNGGVPTGTFNGTFANCTCNCDGTGYGGANCKEPYPCTISDINCNSNGIVDGYTGGGCRCLCNKGFSGENCQTIDKCTAALNGDPCLNLGKPAGLIKDDNCTCECPLEFTGLNCEASVSCSKSDLVCANGGQLTGTK